MKPPGWLTWPRAVVGALSAAGIVLVALGWRVESPGDRATAQEHRVEQLDEEFHEFQHGEQEFRRLVGEFIVRYSCWRLERAGGADEHQARALCYEAPIGAVEARIGMEVPGG